MTFGAYISLARDIGIALALAFIVYRIYTDGKNAAKVDQLKELQVQIEHQIEITESWHTETTYANAQLTKEMASINSTPIVVHDWVRQQSCPQQAVLPAAAGEARNQPANIRPVQSGIGGTLTGDWRDRAVAEFKGRWEGQLATWRNEDAQWPH